MSGFFGGTGSGGVAPPVPPVTGVMKLIEEFVVTGVPIKSFDFSSVLSGETDGQYELDYYVISVNDEPLHLRINQAIASASRTVLEVVAASIASFGASDTFIARLNGGDSHGGKVYIPFCKTSTKPRIMYTIGSVKSDAGSAEIFIGSYKLTIPAESVVITRLGFTQGILTNAATIDVGSTFRLWKRI